MILLIHNQTVIVRDSLMVIVDLVFSEWILMRNKLRIAMLGHKGFDHEMTELRWLLKN